MKQHIDTIPVWDAYKAKCECPLCELEGRNEAMYIENFLGGSVMEPDTRIEVNEKGFCANHFRMLINAGNKLGVALMAHTHLKESATKLPSTQAGKKQGFFAKPKPERESPSFIGNCILCERLNNTMDRYIYTLFYMWKTDGDFRRAFEESSGFCLPHYARIIKDAPANLSTSDAQTFLATAERIQRESLERLDREIEWFTLKFDYRNADKPWGTSQDAVERTLLKLRGYRSILVDRDTPLP